MESQHQSACAVGPAALLQRHRLAKAAGKRPLADPIEVEKQPGHQEVSRFESQLHAISEKLDRCLKGIKDNEDSLKALRQHGLVSVSRLDPSLRGNLPNPESDPPPHMSPSNPSLSPHGSGPIRAQNHSPNDASPQKHPSKAARPQEAILARGDSKGLTKEMRERRAQSGNEHRSGIGVSHTKSKYFGFLSHGAIRINQAKARVRSKFAIDLWRTLEEPGFSRLAYWQNILSAALILTSVVLTLVDSGAEPYFGIEGVMIQLCLDSIFSLEFLLRLYCCPSRRSFLTLGFTMIDILACFPILVVRAMFSMNWPLEIGSWPYLVLIALTPVLRLLLMLRRFEQIHLQISAFRSAAQALPVLIYTLSTLILFFGAAVFMAEPRDNVPSVADGLWMTIVTCYTVGYGDLYPVSAGGRSLFCALMFLSALYMTIPIGIVGDAFSHVWNQRDAILVVHRMSTRLRLAHINAEDIPAFFHRFDEDGNGMINRSEFLKIIRSMSVSLDDSQALELFSILDEDNSGEITDEEFVKVLYPHDFKEMYSALSSVVDIVTSAITTTQEAVSMGAYRVSMQFTGEDEVTKPQTHENQEDVIT